MRIMRIYARRTSNRAGVLRDGISGADAGAWVDMNKMLYSGQLLQSAAKK
jgi:hypothetical protein